MDKELPSRAKLRRDREEPRVAASKTDIVEPTDAKLKTDRELPRRANDLSESDEPMKLL